MLSEQQIVELQEERKALSIRDLAAKHHLSANTVQKYTLGISGPRGSYKRRVLFVDEDGRWATLENALLILLAERKSMHKKSKKLNAAIRALRELVR